MIGAARVVEVEKRATRAKVVDVSVNFMIVGNGWSVVVWCFRLVLLVVVVIVRRC